MLLCRNPITVKRENGDSVQVGCGKCEHCKSSKRSQWKQRLMIEHENCVCTKFCTITYDEPSLYGVKTEANQRISIEPHFYIEDDDTVFYTTSKVDVQKFFKRLRKNFGNLLGPFRYWLVSEFGDQSNRPHYHFFLFLDKYFNDWDLHAMILKSWRLGHIIDVQNVRGPGAFGYLANYLYKQVDGHNDDKEFSLLLSAENDFELQQAQDEIRKIRKRPKTFMLCSRRPAIGLSYLKSKEKLNYHLSDVENNYSALIRGSTLDIPLCSYLKKKIYSKEQQELLSANLQQKELEQFQEFMVDHSPEDWDRMLFEQRENRDYILKHKQV